MAKRAQQTHPQLSFIFTPNGFVCDAAAIGTGATAQVETGGEPGANSPSRALAAESQPWLAKFERDRFQALYELGFTRAESWYTPSMAFLHRIADAFIRFTVQQPDIEMLREHARPNPDGADKAALLLAAPFAPGVEFVDEAWIDGIFDSLSEIYTRELTSWQGSVEQYVAERTQDLRVPGRIFFHLVENKSEAADAFPFAFVATYAAKTDGAIRHFPLRYALEEYEDDTAKLLELLSGLSRAARESTFLSQFMETGELFHPLKLTADEAYAFLKDVAVFEDAGIICRVPNWWKRGAASVKASVRIGENRPAALGADALVQLSPSFVVDGRELTRDEVEQLLAQTEGLAFLKGKWVEVDHERIERLLKAFDAAADSSMSLFEAMRAAAAEPEDGDVLEMTRGTWLDHLITRMRTPARIDAVQVPESLAATLRPYQLVGFSWLSYLYDMGFGSLLADDMGLGKTVQLIALIERLRSEAPGGVRVLLVVPASLVGNWQRELQKFAPALDHLVLYGESAAKMNARWAGKDAAELRESLPTLCVTTYAMAQKVDLVALTSWDLVVLDEAQAIKNPNTKQTRSLKALHATTRIALTGTPVENDLSNLWSVFDFLNPGMLGSLKEFKGYVSDLESSASGYAPLRRTIAPFLLRRLKTDKSIIDDLPEKTEIAQYVELSRKQVILYRKVVAELEAALQAGELSDIKRRGIVLATIMKLKQVCNHPDQYLGQEGFSSTDSGKFKMLEELCATIYEKRERVLVFTQFREMCDPLARLLEGVFERPGCVIHGQVPARRRTKLVERFQSEEYVPFMVLSLKAGGTGLNLTAANNVIHFDRWWNPAVENQATDRAFRIGQTRDVMVHKMVCSNTLEERIAEIIEGKSKLASDVIGEGETWLGDLDDSQLIELMRFGEGR